MFCKGPKCRAKQAATVDQCSLKRVTCVAPGRVGTPMAANYVGSSHSGHPIPRPDATDREIRRGCVARRGFLASEQCEFVTGQVVHIERFEHSRVVSEHK